MNLGDPELELIDPTPNIYLLFVHFDQLFFWTKLASKAVVRWSKRMYSCAGICSYEGRGGLCDIALSEPLLKLRPRKDLVETLLHEMIHAFLFVTNRDSDRDGHGPNFLAHMYRINKCAGLNISVYHSFHDEVKLYQTHWWRCSGPCQQQKPYFGIVRRTCNRAPGPSDFWWDTHQKLCGGTFVKIKEPEKNNKKPTKPVKSKPNMDITKYVNNNDNTLNKNKPKVSQEKKNNPVLVVNNGNLNSQHGEIHSSNVVETVRNIWANKQLPTKPLTNPTAKRLSNTTLTESPPKKIKKIDDYFKTRASFILKDVYGEDFNIVENDQDKLKAVNVKETLVQCPICNEKVKSVNINTHIDECLNKDLIEKISKENIHTDFHSNNKTIVVPIPIKLESNTLFSLDNNIDRMRSDITKTSNDKINTVDHKFENILKPKPIKQENTDMTSLVNIIESKQRDTETFRIKTEPGTSKDIEQKCMVCSKTIDKPIHIHLEECVSGIFSKEDDIFPEPKSTDSVIIIDDDDEFDETLTLNATGTKCPCPCCLEMIESGEMNEHLDSCLT